MELTNRFVQAKKQATKQAPWRTQVQWAGLFLLGTLAVVLIAGLYLDISAKAASAGMDIQELEMIREQTRRKNADMRTRLANLTSEQVMQKRASELGYVDVDPSQVTYLPVKNYPGRQPVILAPSTQTTRLRGPVIKSAYTQSLWEFLFQGMIMISDAQNSEVGR